MSRALVIGGTRGIGLALTWELIEQGWFVYAVGRSEFDIGRTDTWWDWTRTQKRKYDLVVFAAGILDPEPWNKKMWSDYLYSYQVHALGPVYFLAHFNHLIAKDAKIVFITSTGATNEGIADLGYGASKAALDKMARALQANTDFDIRLIRFDLVDTDMMKKLPKDTLVGRKVISAEDAAMEILKCLEL
jgi:NAD(P)-dependent dehydrogenase (short-subunit alcohol dehydrogenase family)